MTPAELWWASIPHGVSILEQAEKAINNDQMLILSAERIPWRDEFYKLLSERIASVNASCPVVQVDWRLARGQAPVEFLGDYFNANEIPDQDLIFDRLKEIVAVCLVKEIPEEDSIPWIQTLTRFASVKGKPCFKLILEMKRPNKKGSKKISLVDRSIEPFDVYYLALSLLASMPFARNRKEYIATLCTEMADNDAEKCADMCNDARELLTDPVLYAEHLGADPNIVRLQVCRAQTRSISPLIDIGRLQLLDVFYGQLMGILPCIDDYGNKIDTINSIELRHLMHFKSTGQLSMDNNLFSLLQCLYNARNDIAHLEELTYDRVEALFAALDKLDSMSRSTS